MTISDFKSFIEEIILIKYSDIIDVHCWKDNQHLLHLKLSSNNNDIVYMIFPELYLNEDILFTFIDTVIKEYENKKVDTRSCGSYRSK